MTVVVKNEIPAGRRPARRAFCLIIWLVVIGSLVFINTGLAQTSQTGTPPAVIQPATKEAGTQQWGHPEWNQPEAYPENFDWVQLASGEWLKGELKFLYEDSLEFDSDELGLLELDWEDVQEVRGHRRYSVRFDGHGKVTGMLHITDDKVFIANMGETREFERSLLIAVAPAATSGLDAWSAKVGLSMNVQKGNTDQVSFNANASAKRRKAASRFSIDYLGIYNQTDGEDTAQNQRANTYYDRFVSRDYYWRVVFGEYFRDPFSNIEHRVTVGSGFGYHIINTSRTRWDFTPGIAYQYSRNKSVEAGENPEQTTPSAVVETVFDTELTKDIDFLASYKINVVNQDSGTYTNMPWLNLK